MKRLSKSRMDAGAVGHRITLLLSVLAALVILVISFAILTSAAKKRAESRNCASSITSICLGAMLWAHDHHGIMPTNFICMSNEVVTPKVLSCVPARRARDWATFGPKNCTYEIVAPGMRCEETNRVFLRCTIHGHLGYSDGTVFDGVRRRGKFG